MTRSPRIVVAIATLSGCLILGVVIGAFASPGGGTDGDQPAASRPATPVSTTNPPTTTTALSVASSAPPTTAPPVTEPPTTAAPTTVAGPVADFGWSPEAPRRGESIRLVDHSTGGPVSYTWRWGGSVIHSSRAGNIAFSVQRDTDVTLTVCDQAGRCADATKTIVVS
jgi:hypothetical protein